MKFTTFFLCNAVLPLLLLSSCGEDPKLVEKREEQKAQITHLKGEIALIDEKLKNLPADVSQPLAEAREQSAKQAAEIGKLEAELAALDVKKRALQKEFDGYRVKYQVK